MGKPIMYVEIEGTYAPRLAAFYSELFDWKFFNPGSVQYSMFQSGEKGIGGAVYPNPERRVGSNIVPYVQVEDIEATCAKVIELGGAVVYPKREIPQTGWSSHVSDPDGNIIGLFTPLPIE